MTVVFFPWGFVCVSRERHTLGVSFLLAPANSRSRSEACDVGT